MSRFSAAIGAGALLLAATGSWALESPSYRAGDVEKYFSQDADLGKARSLCIGTGSECSKDSPSKPQVSSGFNLLVNFNYKSDVLTPGARANLDEFAKALRGSKLDSVAFTVEGHTDAVGGDSYNQDLSLRRAQSVVQYLTDQGVEVARLEAKAYGKTRPMSGNPNDAVNRRVEAHIRTN